MKTYNISIFLLLIFCSFAFGVEPIIYEGPISFRSQALGGIIDDDLDLIYDPIELRFVKGIRLYTNLSNLTSGKEQILSGVYGMPDNEFLFGVSLKNPIINNLWSSALIRYQNAKFSDPISLDTDLDGNTDVFFDGYYKDIYTAYLDTDFNGLYDLKRLISQDKTNFSFRKSHVFIINNSYLSGNWTFGLKFMKSKFNSESTDASGYYGMNELFFGSMPGDPSYNLNYNTFNVESNFNNLSWDEKGDYLSEDEDSYWAVDFSVMRPFVFPLVDTLEVRGNFGYLKGNYQSNFSDVFSGRRDDFDEDIPELENYYTENEELTRNDEEKGSRFRFGLSFKKVFDKAAERKNDGFWEIDLGLLKGSSDYDMNQMNTFGSVDYFFDGIDTMSIDETLEKQWNSSKQDNGDVDLSSYFAGGRINIPLGERVFVGLGLSLNSFTYERTTEYQGKFDGTLTYDILDTLNDMDREEFEDSSWVADRNYEETLYRFSVPVGIEYKFTNNKKWSLRFGSIFTYTKNVFNDSREITKSEPYEKITRYGNGVEDVFIADNIYQSYSSQRKVANSTTIFVYGLGFQPTENLQIDLIGFLGTDESLEIIDADFYRKLRLSFSLKL